MPALKGWISVVVLTLMMATFLGAPIVEAVEEASRGVVLETMNSGGYTYVLLDRAGAMEWFAVPESQVKVGDEIQILPGAQMGSYTSPTLGRTFDAITFSSGISGVSKRGGTTAENKVESPEEVKITKAEGPDAYTIAEIFEKKDALNGKKIMVRGKVVKSSEFGGLQWLRLVDGTGSSKRGNHKLVVTTTQTAAKDNIVAARGTVKTGKAIGALTYEVIVEEARIEKQAE